ncbi:hypothetical protein EV175_001272 [Coemansia sp. RSA 1933]|nr:hypothetical protein EV175_001272 [Coemansia sp. RSA 1933]
MTGQRRRVEVVPSEDLAGISLSTPQLSQSARAIAAQLQLIESSKATDRARGVQELASILRDDANGGGVMAASFTPSAWEHIVTWTVRIVIKESQSYVNKYREEWPDVSPAGERMCSRVQTQYSSHIRHIWIAAIPYLSDKPTRFLVKHITESLVNDPCLSQVFGLDYAKVLGAWSAHETHVRNCKDGRTEEIVDLCIRSVSKFGSTPESQASVESSAGPSISPGDLEYAQVLFAVVSIAKPVLLNKISQKVMTFCSEYCRFHVRENGCLATILNTANTVMLSRPDTYLVSGLEHVKGLLSSALKLWQTRSAALKHSTLYTIRITTRMLAHANSSTKDSDAISLMRLSLKTISTGAWDRFKFMNMPRELLSIWHLISSYSIDDNHRTHAVPRWLRSSMIFRLHSIIDPLQLAFFDTAAFLVAYLSSQSSQPDTRSTEHRQKRNRTVPTPISRLLAVIGSYELPANSRGTAQVLWFTINVYSNMLDDMCLADLFHEVRVLIQSSDMSYHSEIAEWVLGVYRSLLASGRLSSVNDGLCVSSMFDKMWGRAIAGVEAGLYGTAGSLFDMLHGCGGPSDLVHALCRQAADALIACPNVHQPDAVQLLLLVVQYMCRGGHNMSEKSMIQLCTGSITRFCRHAAKAKWSADLFAHVSRRIFGFDFSLDQTAKASAGDQYGYFSVPDPCWSAELRFAQMMHVLAAFSDDPETCESFVAYHSSNYCRSECQTISTPSTPRSSGFSSLSNSQWRMVFDGLLKSLDLGVDSKRNLVLGTVIPYVALVLAEICAHTKQLSCPNSTEPLESSTACDKDAVQMGDAFSESLASLARKTTSPSAIWKLLSFISPWKEAYCRIASLESLVEILFTALFDHSNPDILCALSMGDIAGRTTGSSHDRFLQIEAHAYKRTEEGHPSTDKNQTAIDYSGYLSSQTDSTALRIIHRPWWPTVQAISAIVSDQSIGERLLAKKLDSMIASLGDTELLVSCELLMHCIMLCAQESRDRLLGQLKNRVLSFLDSYEHIGHAPTLFCALRIVQYVICAPESDGLIIDEDMLRFVAWICDEASGNLLDVSVETFLLRSLLGAWARNENKSLDKALSILDFSATDILLRCAQMSLSFAVRIVAEEQLASLGLGLPYLSSQGSIAYPDAPKCDVDDMLVLMTRDIGAGLLSVTSGSVIPGSLVVLLMQLHSNIGCAHHVTQLCRRLLVAIATLSGFGPIDQMISLCAFSILSIEPDLYSVFEGSQYAQKDAASRDMLRVELALEYIVRGDLEKAKDVLPHIADDGDDDACAQVLYAHSVVLSVTEPELYSRVREAILIPFITARRIEIFAKETPEAIILQILRLYKPADNVSAELIRALAAISSKPGQSQIAHEFTRIYDEQLKEKSHSSSSSTSVVRSTASLPQWGRRYGTDAICSAINAVTQSSSGSKSAEFLTSSRASWVAAHIHALLCSALYDDERQRLVCSLGLLVQILHPDTLDSPLFQAMVFRAAFDSWLLVPGRTDAMCCFILCAILDSSTTLPVCDLFGSIGPGLLDSLIKYRSHGLKPGVDAMSVPALTYMLQAIANTQRNESSITSSGLFIDTGLETLRDWSSLASLVVTKDTIRTMDDRMALASVAKRAVSMLDMKHYSLACAEILVESIEQLVKLALPLDKSASSFALTDPEGGRRHQIHLSKLLIHDLLSIRTDICRHVERHSDDADNHNHTTAMLLRALSLLTAFEVADEAIGVSPSPKDKAAKDGDVYYHICNTITHSRNQGAVLAAINVAAKLSSQQRLKDGSVSRLDSALKWADAAQKWVMRDVVVMPSMLLVSQSYPAWAQGKSTVDLDTSLLELLCSPSIPADAAFSELVCALALHRNSKQLNPAIPLILADAHTASCLLPHIIHELVLDAQQEERAEISSFLLDFAYNWHKRSPRIARDTIFRTLETRQLSSQFSDIRDFFAKLPIALFEMADLAEKLSMSKTAAFLLECDLTCTNAERQPVIADISAEAKGLLRSVYHSLGNQPAAQLLEPISSVSEIMRRCHDTSDWRTLLLYQEAASKGSTRSYKNGDSYQSQSTADHGAEFSIGDTLVNLGLLNSIRPELSWNEGSSKEAGEKQAGASSSAMFAASWRLSKWDLPSIPLSQQGSSTASTVFLTPASGAEESLYSIFKLRHCSRLAEVSLAAQNYMSSTSAISALTGPTDSDQESWSYQTVGMLLPLITGSGCCAKMLDADEFVHTSQIAEYILARSRTSMGAKMLARVYSANVTLHEIAICDASTQTQDNQAISQLFGRYKDAVHSACVVSRQAGNWQASMSYIFRLRSLAHAIRYDNRLLELELKLWEAETLWDAGNKNMAIEVLQSHKKATEKLVKNLEGMQMCGNLTFDTDAKAAPFLEWTNAEIETATMLLSKIILTVGEWSDTQRKERPAVLWDEYFNKSAKLLQDINSPTSWTGRALNALAEFSERQCEELTLMRDSEASIAVRKQKSRELAACQHQLSRTTTSAETSRLKTILRRLEAQVSNDQKEHAELRSNIGGFLRLAVWSFIKCLECCSTFDDSVYSLVSLIMTHSRIHSLHSILSSGLLDSVPSHKLLPLSHQLCARLGTENDIFHTTLAHLVRRMSIDYPYHMLYHLFALRNANRTSSSTEPSKAMRRTSSFIAQQASESEKMEQRRSEAATSIIVGIASNSSDLGRIVRAIEELCNMYIELAVTPVPDKYKSSKLEGKLIEFSSKLKIKKLVKNLPPNIPVLTALPRAEAPRDYMCVPFISTIADGYTLAGGINLPKITRVMGTDGKRYKQLVKGKDDMRQDAIIEQLFHVINNCMGSAERKAPELTPSSSSGMRVRTYQVVPLTKRCGVLQWVDNTVPLGDWFREKEAKYRPNAPGMAQLRSTVHSVHTDKATTVNQKLEVFNNVCKIAPPVFRFFFYEYFYDSQSWFEHREVYTRSAAVSSIAGWVLGIGDRHLQNILMDRSTAEVVHIDLGIAFDLGKLLPIPEMVPFRLTREMIDGMGLLGLQGTFRNTCEMALRVMRVNSRVVITILNVLKVDPLYMWSLIPLRMDKMNLNMTDEYVDEVIDHRDVLLAEDTNAAVAEDENKEAWRSIIHVGQRLDARISAEGQVSELIQQATDPVLLSRMYEGWSAWY